MNMVEVSYARKTKCWKIFIDWNLTLHRVYQIFNYIVKRSPLNNDHKSIMITYTCSNYRFFYKSTQ